MKETIFYVFLAFSVIFDAHNDKNEWIFNTWSMFSKTCPIPVCDKSFEKTPLSSLLSGCVSSKPLSREIALKTQAMCLLCDIYYMILLEWNTKLAYCILIKLILQSLLLTFFFAICFCKHVIYNLPVQLNVSKRLYPDSSPYRENVTRNIYPVNV
jgi:hypothetical protein